MIPVRYILAMLWCLSSLILFAQSAERPVLHTGDTLYLSRDLLPSPIDLTSSGSGQYWDMGRLLSPFVQQSVVRQGDQDGIIITGTGNVDRHMRESDEGLFITALGLANGSGEKIKATFDPPLPWVKSMQEGETDYYEGTLRCANDMKYAVRIQSVVDASGELYIPTGRYEVMRLRRDIDITPLSGYAKNPNDIGLPIGLMPGRVFVYLSQNSAVPVATVQADAMNQAKQVEYLSQPWSGTVVEQIPMAPDIFVYPNPSFGNVRFDLLNLIPGRYELEVYNILGVKLRTEQFFVNGTKTMPLDLSGLKRGTYIYRLVDTQQNTIRSKRMVIITP